MNFYREAASIIDQVEAKKGSIKSCLSRVDEKTRKRTAALVIETLKYKHPLTIVIQNASLLKEEKRHLNPNFALVLVHDLLLAKGIQASDGPVKQAVLRHKTRLQAEWTKLKIKKGVTSNEDLAQSQDLRAESIPRYVRVNTNLWTMQDAVAYFEVNGYLLVDHLPNLSTLQFTIDAHVSNLLCFHHSTSFQKDENYLSGRLILQDKASCFPSTILCPPTNAYVIDATSAPGNKTTHISALMGNTGNIFAFERDARRFETLQTMLKKAACTNTHPIHADFLTIKPLDPRFGAVTHILLDPSCSGSGIVNRLDYLVEAGNEEEEVKAERLQKLSMFQLNMIRHAMKFPKVEKIVYSTCSIHVEENEHVAKQALESPEAKGLFRLAPRDLVLPSWSRRGLVGEIDSPDSVLRCLPGEDATNGFFVACFIRYGSSYDTQNPNRLLTKRKIGPQGESEVQENLSGSEWKGIRSSSSKKKKRKKQTI